ncbi:MAG: DUF3291 domain-containing protein [Pikeienuella sp.]
MPALNIALYTFGLFIKPAEHEANDGFHVRNDIILANMDGVPGFIARSGYDDDPAEDLWGEQVYPHFYVENGDGWAPATLSLWESPEAMMAFTYSGLHGEAVRMGHQWFQRGDWPPLVMWWVDERPCWADGVERFERLHRSGPTPNGFSIKCLFGQDGRPIKVDTAKLKEFKLTDSR